MPYSKHDQEILRTLAQEYMEYASLPIQKETLNLWKALNSHHMQRPMVAIDQVPWNEFASQEELTCQVTDPFWREFELKLRQQLYQWRHFPADMVLEPYLTIPAAISFDTTFGLKQNYDFTVIHQGETAQAKHYNTTIHNMEDLQKIQDYTIMVDKTESDRRMEEAKALFHGISPIRLEHGVQFHLGIWDFLPTYLGVESIFYDFIDRPEFLHAAADRVTNAVLVGIKAANELKAHNDIANTCHCSYVYHDTFLPDFGKGLGSESQNCWAFGMAQIMTSVGPDMFEEFELPYITRLAEQFGMIYYGCCDRLDNKLDVVRKIPHVQKVSCSPWSDRVAFAEKIGRNLVMSNKPTPAYLATDQFDEDEIRKDLSFTCQCAKENNINLELILKDISTVNFQPQRLSRWSEIAMEVVQSI